jgi:CRISPR system Cascade subunit CasE
MAFPSPTRRDDDKEFLKPYSPDDFPETRYIADRKAEEAGREALEHVHAPRSGENGFLFRVEPQPGGNVVILVLSAIKPDWEYAFHNAGHFLAAAPEVKTYDPVVSKGERFRFRLVANPTRKCSKNSKDSKGNPVDARWVGKRVPVPYDRLKEWLDGKGKESGFKVDSAVVQSGYIYVDKRDGKLDSKRLLSVRFEGILTVIDPEHFRQTLLAGIGPAKAFGFGLLSIAPVE